MKMIAFAADHAGFELKSHLIQFAQTLGWQTIDLGTNSQEAVDYPDFIKPVCEQVLADKVWVGILICGTGTGMDIGANRIPGIRAALCQSGLEAKLARQKNHANILCLGSKLIGTLVAEECLETFLHTEYEGGRHARRVEKLG